MIGRSSRATRAGRGGPAGAVRGARGFTLLEVMVALGLLAAALMAIADLTGNALRNHEYARDLSAATLLARGKMAELEQKYEDEGFRDFDQHDDGDFSDASRPDVRWHVDLIRPDPDLSADQLFSLVAGTGTDPQALISRVMGSAGGATASGTDQASTSSASPAAALVSRLIQAQLTTFGETLKKSFREMRLTVSWRDGKATHSFTVTTHLVVLNPRAPGGARGDNPDVPPNLTAAPAAATAQPATTATQTGVRQ